MGKALLELTSKMRGRKLDDGKALGRKGRLTKKLIEGYKTIMVMQLETMLATYIICTMLFGLFSITESASSRQ